MIGALLLIAGSASPSFDCARARTQVERAICADPALALRDKAVDVLYTRATKAFSYPAGFVRGQRLWLRRRNGCNTNDCIQRAYDERIDALTRTAPSDQRFQHTNYVPELNLTQLEQDWYIFAFGMALNRRSGHFRFVEATGLVHIVDGAGRWTSDEGCVLNFRKAGSAWRIGVGTACRRTLHGQCFGGFYYRSEDWISPARKHEIASCDGDG